MQSGRKFLKIVFIIFSVLINLSIVTPGKSQENIELPDYVIQSGDNISTIALKFNTTPDEILAVNQLADANLLRIGDRIKIPGLNGISGTLITKIVPFGISINHLSRQYQIPPDILLSLNNLTSPSEAFAGSSLIIPVKDPEGTTSQISLPTQGLSVLELSIRNNANTWQLLQSNQLDKFWQILPNDPLFLQTASSASQQYFLPGIVQVAIDSLPLKQGQTFIIKVNSEKPLEINANLAGINIPFYSENINEHTALHGISAIAEPGAYPLTLTISDKDSQQYSFEQWVLIKEGYFAFDPIIYVDPQTLDSDLITKEDEIFQKIIDKPSSVRLWDGIFKTPVGEPVCIRGDYGNRRSYNDGALFYYHTGIDYGWCAGIDVFAPAKGIVVATEKDQVVRGNALLIDHGWGIFTGYWHLEEFLVNVGDIVEPGQLIAHLGNTGRSGGPHLHFEIIVNGISVDPTEWLTKEFK